MFEWHENWGDNVGIKIEGTGGFGFEINCKPVWTFLCVRIDNNNDAARSRNWMRQEIGRKYSEKRFYISYDTKYLHRVRQKSLERFREISIRIELSNSRYKRQIIASGNNFFNFNSILILPLSICDVWPSDALCSGVRSRSKRKSQLYNIRSYLKTRVQVMYAR
jgi:disulfide oxidoreductase YuzD